MTQVEDFIDKWFRYVFDAKSTTGETTARSMISDIKAHPGIEKLIDNPSMLAAICILYHDGRELPRQRAEFYKKFISNLLFRRFKNDHERVNGYLKKLSLEMFTAGYRGIDRAPALVILKTEFTQGRMKPPPIICGDWRPNLRKSSRTAACSPSRRVSTISGI
jgi:hypothetical protein